MIEHILHNLASVLFVLVAVASTAVGLGHAFQQIEIEDDGAVDWRFLGCIMIAVILLLGGVSVAESYSDLCPVEQAKQEANR